MRARGVWVVAFLALCAAPRADAAVVHVRAGAPAAGTGSAAAPVGSLAEVEAASAPGDMIVGGAAGAALAGGLAVKPGQRLEGGPPGPGTARVVTNTQASRLDGDAVRLADGVTVSGIVVRGAVRGGIYGLDTVGVTIAGNDVSGHNTLCSAGFLVQPFNVPTGVPFVGGGVAGNGTLAPQNGWAGGDGRRQPRRRLDRDRRERRARLQVRRRHRHPRGGHLRSDGSRRPQRAYAPRARADPGGRDRVGARDRHAGTGRVPAGGRPGREHRDRYRQRGRRLR